MPKPSEIQEHFQHPSNWDYDYSLARSQKVLRKMERAIDLKKFDEAGLVFDSIRRHYANRLTQGRAAVVARRISIPLYEMAHHWKSEDQLTQSIDAEKLSTVHAQTMDLMSRICGEIEAKGLCAELAVIGLINHGLLVNDSPEYLGLPSSMKEESGGGIINGISNGIDVRVVTRDPSREIPLQVKYRESGRFGVQSSHYRDDILMVSLEEIAGGDQNIQALQSAMVDDSRGESTVTSDVMILQAKNRLRNKFDSYLHNQYQNKPNEPSESQA